MKTVSIRTLTYVIPLLIACVLGIFAFVVWDAASTVRQANAEERAQSGGVRLLKDFKFGVSGVQQFLTDVGATGDEGGLAEALEQRKLGLEAVRQLGVALPQYRAATDALSKDLLRLHDAGVVMAKAYVSEGRDAGNALMKKPGDGFDDVSKALTEKADALAATLTAEAEAAGRRQDAATTWMMRSSIGFSLVVLVLIVVLNTTVLRYIRRQLGGEPAYALGVMRRIAGGDLAMTVRTAENDRHSLLFSIQGMLQKLAGTIGQVKGAAEALSDASGQVSATAQSLSQSSSQQAASVEETSASMEQMTASIAHNTENARVTDDMATRSSAQAEQGGAAVKETVEAMKTIAGKIGIIDDIAYQTNLLALNAAIEAARAGEHGKGFAVVAAEVRKLAERSQVAAQEIGELADASVMKAEQAGKLLDEMVPSIRKTSDLVQEIATASEEQSTGVGQINGAIGQLNKATQQNASASEQLAATAQQLGGQAAQLQELMEFFKLESQPGGSPVKRSRPATPPATRATVAEPVARGDFERF